MNMSEVIQRKKKMLMSLLVSSFCSGKEIGFPPALAHDLPIYVLQCLTFINMLLLPFIMLVT